jgi:very-short-patch-repair endonuclease
MQVAGPSPGSQLRCSPPSPRKSGDREKKGAQQTLLTASAINLTAPGHRQGFQIVRYWNNDVLKNPEGVLTDILVRLEVK